MATNLIMNLDQIHIFRIFHIDNLEFILRQNKLTTYNSPDADPDYRGIGEGELIGLRANHEITTDNSQQTYCPSCNFLPFYFAPRSVMLYRIQSGYKVAQIPQENIIHMVFKLEDILPDIEYLFTDGHGYARFTRWFDDVDFLSELDWKTIPAKQWNDTEIDMDRQRRKQAEFWIKEEISLEKLIGIGVYNQAAFDIVTNLCQNYQRNIPVKVKNDYYY
ncbi:MAG: DUF4433 domain-containing protein [Bacteroidia bacterium]